MRYEPWSCLVWWSYSLQLQHPTPLWQNNVLLRATEELRVPSAHPPSTPSSSSSLSREWRKSHSAAKEPRNQSTPGNADYQTLPGSVRTVSAGTLSDSQRPELSTKLRGRLGHLVTAIADAHQATSPNGSIRQPQPPVSVLSHQAWLGSSTAESHDNAQDSPNSSYGSIEVLMCRLCDRMFHSKAALEEHSHFCVS